MKVKVTIYNNSDAVVIYPKGNFATLEDAKKCFANYYDLKGNSAMFEEIKEVIIFDIKYNEIRAKNVKMGAISEAEARTKIEALYKGSPNNMYIDVLSITPEKENG